MLYNGKELTSQEVADLLQQKDAQLAEKDGEIKKLQEVKAPVTEASTPETKPEETKLAEPASTPVVEDADKKLSEGKELSETDKKLAEKDKENRTLSEKIIILEERNRIADVEKALSAYDKKGVPASIIEAAKKIMFSDVSSAKSYKFKEGDKEVVKSLSDCVLSILDLVGTIQLSEVTRPSADGSSDVSGDSESKRHEAIKQYMEQNKCDYKTAYLKLLSEKKIEEIKVL